MRRAARLDGNHHEIADYLERHQWTVWNTSGLGDGFPDLIVSREYCGKQFTAVVEIKDPAKVPSKRKLTEKEQTFRDNWQGAYVLAETGPQAHEDLSMEALAVWGVTT